MQYVNDDMDELFRKAAENYPLDTNSANWNKVLAAMQGAEATGTTPEKKRNKKGRFLWLLLLLPLAFIGNELYFPGKHLNKAAVTAVQRENAHNNREGGQARDLNRTSSPSRSSSFNNGTHKPEATTTSAIVFSVRKPLSPSTSNSSKKKLGRTNALNNFHHDDLPVAQTEKGRSVENENISAKETIAVVPWKSKGYLSAIVVRDRTKEVTATNVKRDLTPISNPFDKEVKKPKTGRENKKFYAGLMGGIDATTIKFQKIEDAGFSYGLLIGKELNRKWSVEAGYFIEGKYYYSEGKYFNTSKIAMPSNSWISDVSGNCKMIEVPVSVKYNFASNTTSDWFATLGASSYFMKQESYTYNYYYGSVGPVPHYKKYDSSSGYLFSNLSISAGYEHQLGNSSYLRIEPYIKIPLTGVGIGELPLSSTGVQLSIIKKF